MSGARVPPVLRQRTNERTNTSLLDKGVVRGSDRQKIEPPQGTTTPLSLSFSLSPEKTPMGRQICTPTDLQSFQYLSNVVLSLLPIKDMILVDKGKMSVGTTAAITIGQDIPTHHSDRQCCFRVGRGRRSVVQIHGAGRGCRRRGGVLFFDVHPVFHDTIHPCCWKITLFFGQLGCFGLCDCFSGRLFLHCHDELPLVRSKGCI